MEQKLDHYAIVTDIGAVFITPDNDTVTQFVRGDQIVSARIVAQQNGGTGAVFEAPQLFDFNFDHVVVVHPCPAPPTAGQVKLTQGVPGGGLAVPTTAVQR